MEVLERIEINTHAAREKLFTDLYERAFPSVARFVSKMRGSFQDAKDIFHDALVIYYEKIQDEKLTINSEPEAYVLGIARHLWMRKFNRDHKSLSFDALESDITTEDNFTADVSDRKLLQFLERTGKRCMDLLQAFYYEKMAMTTIASLFGFRNEHSATVQKYKCIEKVRDTIKEKSMNYEDFLE
jgi:RNA polymerase sigma factor (sigma-70 family)